MMIREATTWDIPACVKLAEEFRGASTYGQFMDKGTDLTPTAEYAVNDPDAVMFIAKIDTKIIGLIALAVPVHMVLGQRTLIELCWYVNPVSRGTAGVRLFDRAEKWGQDRGVSLSIMIAPNERVAAFLKRRGYTKLEEQYIKRLVRGSP